MLSCGALSIDESVKPIGLVKVGTRTRERVVDRVAVERPLEVRLDDEPFAVIMRTPGDDRCLALGFLVTEGILRTHADFASAVTDGDIVNVRLAGERAAGRDALIATRRNVAMNSSCGLCGRRSLDEIEVEGPALPIDWTVDPGIVLALPARLAAHQPAFDETGGLHAAALATPAGVIDASAEDVGRHNAVDKLIGRMWLVGRVPLAGSILVVSGRLSFEIV